MGTQSQQSLRGVRFGGIRTPRGYVFELTGGRLCLDLANTLDERRSAEPRELLAGYQDLVDWGLQTGSIDHGEARALRSGAAAQPGLAERAVREARVVREIIFDIFSRLAAGCPVPSDRLDAFNARLRHAARYRAVAPRGGELVWRWTGGCDLRLDRPLWPGIWSAAELLVAPERQRVRQCEGERCAWLFLDESRNGSRRWCDMSVCGNRAKARRHYARSKESRCRASVK